jgi:acetoin utilization protein AcuC
MRLDHSPQPQAGAARRVLVIADEAVGRYGFPDAHPFGPDRQGAFLREFRERGLQARTLAGQSRAATEDELRAFHTQRYIDFVKERSAAGQGRLDAGDTPAFPGCYEITCQVVGATLNAAQALLDGKAERAFVPIAGLHHAARDAAAGFCIFNDCGVLIEQLRAVAGLDRIAYVDIDAHHGDGVFYAFESDAAVIFADVHEDGHYLYPGTGHAQETGLDAAAGTKLNIPLEPGSDDARFADVWPAVIAHLERHQPQFIILQCGADSIGGDPITHLQLTEASHALAATSLSQLADRLGHGHVLALGGGGYNRGNIARGWNAVVEAFLKS